MKIQNNILRFEQTEKKHANVNSDTCFVKLRYHMQMVKHQRICMLFCFDLRTDMRIIKGKEIFST